MSPKPERITSIDLFRGYVILNMVFFNDIAGAANVPAWMHHAPEGSNSMTYVDAGVPTFLFIMGMSIPLAFRAREIKGISWKTTWGHILLRSLALIVMGLWMAWSKDFDPAAVGMPKPVWAMAMYLGFFMLWFSYPPMRLGAVRLNSVLPILGGATLSALAWIYHRGMQTQSFYPEWWGILGALGWAYLITSAAYFLLRRHIVWLAVFLVAGLTQYYAAAGWIDVRVPFSTEFIMASVPVIVGAALSRFVFVDAPHGQSTGKKLMILCTALFGIWSAAHWHTSSYGIAKNEATPSYMLFSICTGLLIYIIFFVAIRFFKGEIWLKIFKPAGQLPLTSYLIAEAIYEPIVISGLAPLAWPLYSGNAGFLCSTAITALVAWIIYRIYKLDWRWGF